MPSLTVVEDFDVVEDRFRQIEPGPPVLSVQQFDLHRLPMRFHHRVVVPVTDRPSVRASGVQNGSCQ